MAAVRDRVMLGECFSDVANFAPQPQTVYLYGTLEERSTHLVSWKEKAKDVNFIEIKPRTDFSVDAVLQEPTSLFLRNIDGLKEFLIRLAVSVIYVDITGLSFNFWAPLIKAAIDTNIEIRVIYVEPDAYSLNRFPTKGEIFDLSERIGGLAPIPGFVAFSEGTEETVEFVPLLGFEGSRFQFLLEQVQPPGNNVHPIVGAPGFRLEYPFYTYLGNEAALSQSKAWRNVRFARASCPFSAYYSLCDLRDSSPGGYFKVAPIGTKPHALGALLFALKYPSQVEIVYDHPRSNPSRTHGRSNFHLYPISAFLSVM